MRICSRDMKAKALRATLSKVPGLHRLAQEIRIRRRSLHDARDVDRAAIMRRLAANLSLPDLPARRRERGEIWAITMVKNEADIIDRSVQHLLKQGVDHVLVADNLSTDATPDILTRLSRDHPVHVAHDRDPAHYQSWKMGLLAQAARRSGADWIVPFDADELWFGARGTLGA